MADAADKLEPQRSRDITLAPYSPLYKLIVARVIFNNDLMI